jgi:hypothetical protein
MKAGSNFKMDKEVKRVAATIIDSTTRGEYKRTMIDAQLAFEKAKRDAMKQKRNDGGGDE